MYQKEQNYYRKENAGNAAPLPNKKEPKEKVAQKKRNLIPSRDREERKL
jgi:hypothetical protein